MRAKEIDNETHGNDKQNVSFELDPLPEVG